MRNVIVLAVALIIAAASNSSPVSAHHLKSPEEMCSYTTRGDCLLAKRFLYEYCHQPERVNEEECVKWPTLDSPDGASPTATPTATPSTALTSTEPISSGTEPTARPSSNPVKTSLDPAVSPKGQPKETSTQTVTTETEALSPQPTSTIVANTSTAPDGTQVKNDTPEKVTFFSARTRIGWVIGLVVLLIAALIAEAKQSKK